MGRVRQKSGLFQEVESQRLLFMEQQKTSEKNNLKENVKTWKQHNISSTVCVYVSGSAVGSGTVSCVMNQSPLFQPGCFSFLLLATFHQNHKLKLVFFSLCSGWRVCWSLKGNDCKDFSF
ncbi:hypothetical protein XENORESO_008618 [Xenotaenia resolanae]|uniref:Uncharacterized protein n=1 Tax=Xenotaenia resolanae TaxID=208358 RepID=A0ABV0X1L5_9TELE